MTTTDHLPDVETGNALKRYIDEYKGLERRYADLPVPAQSADLGVPAARVDGE